MTNEYVNMIKPDEGYIKFNLLWEQKEFDFHDQDFEQINLYRSKLFELNLIGEYPDGIGFGNISHRLKDNQFIISGSATGNYNKLEKEHYSLVTDFDIKNNQVTSVGLTKASSESMSHAAIYKIDSKINAVIHIHNKRLWNKYLNILPTTNKHAEFGTPELAFEIQKHIVDKNGVIIMGGHPEGIISYGSTIEESYNLIIKHYNEI